MELACAVKWAYAAVMRTGRVQQFGTDRLASARAIGVIMVRG
jgi:hypothetical protein